MDSGSAHTSLHRGAVYLHQGQTYLVAELSLEDAVALVEPADPDYTTLARDLTDIVIADTLRTIRRSRAALHYGTVDVTNQVVGFMRRRLVTGEIVGDEPLDLPARQLRTKGVWWTVSDDLVERADIDIGAVPGAAHAAEHASIGLLPLFATCDRWDIGGVSTARHPDTGCTTVFVYDGAPGGAGFAERGYAAGVRWLTTTRDAIRSCECEAGCPSCVQSPKCGNGNAPLDKGAAVRLLDALLGELAHAGG
jgi:DEAD/DEAH box helicase domain-containing protein